MTKPALSEQLQALIEKAGMIDLSTWGDTHGPAALQIFQAAEAEERFLTDGELLQLQGVTPGLETRVVGLIRDRNSDIIAAARAEVLRQFPGINQPGGALYPAKRSEACWRDFYQFLRSISYGIASLRSHYISPDGLHHLQLLYREVNVPLDAMVVGLEGLKAASLQRLTPEQHPLVAPYFDQLIEPLKQFHSS